MITTSCDICRSVVSELSTQKSLTYYAEHLWQLVAALLTTTIAVFNAAVDEWKTHFSSLKYSRRGGVDILQTVLFKN